MADTRSVICTVLGHVDHGKSSLLDKIRDSAVAKGEAGAITQAIGASIIPLEKIKEICGNLLDQLKTEFTVPGLLFIDTPGHEAFNNLRKRGGALADIAIVVIDIKEGIKDQTKEVIDILKSSKTPFVIAANKIDLIDGWQNKEDRILQSIAKQYEKTQEIIDKKIYEIVGKLSELGISSERFDRVDDYTKQIAIIPTSSVYSNGVPELLMVLLGLAQKYLENCLKCNIHGNAKSTILEVKDQKGTGLTIDAILYDGNLKVGDTIVIGAIGNPIVTKVKGLFEPEELSEMRDKKSKFKAVKGVTAAIGVRIVPQKTEGIIAGMPLYSCSETDIEKTKQEVQSQIDDVIIDKDKVGVVIKADNMGSLEALITLLRKKEIPIRKASIGAITKKDIQDAESNFEKNPLESVVIGFNVLVDVKETGNVKVIVNNVIYKIIEDLENWRAEQIRKKEQENFGDLTKPGKIEIMQGYIFRQNNPAVCGVHVLEGEIKTGIGLMKKDGYELTTVKSIQLEQENLQKAERNAQVAISMPKVTIGRQIFEGDILYTVIPEDEFRKLKEFKKLLSAEDISILKEIAEIMRKNNPMWGV